MVLREQDLRAAIRSETDGIADRDRQNEAARDRIRRIEALLQAFDCPEMIAHVEHGAGQDGSSSLATSSATMTSPSANHAVAESGMTDGRAGRKGIDLALEVMRQPVRDDGTFRVVEIIEAVSRRFAVSLNRRSLQSQLTKRERVGRVEHIGSRWRLSSRA